MKVTPDLQVERVLVENAKSLISKIGGGFQIVRGNCTEEVAFAALLSLRSFDRETNHARTLGGELLLRLAGTLQIKDAIKERGIVNGENYLVVFGSPERAEELIGELGLKKLPPLECEPEKLKTFFEKSALVEVM